MQLGSADIHFDLFGDISGSICRHLFNSNHTDNLSAFLATLHLLFVDKREKFKKQKSISNRKDNEQCCEFFSWSGGRGPGVQNLYANIQFRR